MRASRESRPENEPIPTGVNWVPSFSGRRGLLANGSSSRGRIPRTVVLLGVVSLFVAGFAIAAVTIKSGSPNLGTGNHGSGSILAWWTLTGFVVTTIPSTVPSAASTAVGSPTILPAAGTSYVANTATAGHTALEFQIQETTSAPASTEVEISFTVTVGSTTTTVTVFVESQASPPTSAQTFNFYYDAGTGTTIKNEQEVGQVCSSVGTCP